MTGSNLTQNLRCAGTDYRIDATLKLTDKGGKVRGSWNEKTYDANGGVTGTAKDDTIHARISGDKFSGRMSHQRFRWGPRDQHHSAQRGHRHLSSGSERVLAPLAAPRA